MHAAIIGPALCCCGHSFTARAHLRCPNCNRTHYCRITPARLAMLRAFAANPLAPRNRAALASLVDLGLLRASGPRPAGSDIPRTKAPLRPYAPTPSGELVLAVADRIFEERIAEQTRHDVAASVVRHSQGDQ